MDETQPGYRLPSGSLSVQQGPMAGKIFPLKKPEITIGRVAGNDIIIPHPQVSRSHARLSWDGQNFILQDLGSTNGTFVNGVRITDPTPLQPGDVINLGELPLAYQAPPLSPAAIEALEETQAGFPAQAKPGYPPPGVTPARKFPWGLILGGILAVISLLALLVVVGVMFFRSRPATEVAFGSPTVTVTTTSAGEGGITPYLATPSPTATSGGILFPTASPTPSPTMTTIPALTPTTCILNAAFVGDVTVPDGSIFPPGQSFNKVWRIRNNGNCPWDTTYQLAFIGGDLMGAIPAQYVSPTAPEGMADISITMYAPATTGTYTGRWQMRDPQGHFFGQVVIVKIVVPATPTWTLPPPIPTDTPTSPPSPTPPVEINFRADDYTLDPGDCTMLRWDVEYATAVYLRWDGNEEGVVGHSQKQVCHSSPGSYIYTLHVVYSGGSEDRIVTINVSGLHPPLVTLVPPLHITPLLPPFPLHPVYSTGLNTVHGTWCFDLDEGNEVSCSSGTVDFWWEQVTSVERYLVPKNGARFTVMGTTQPQYNDCASAPLSTASINGSNNASNQIPTGTYLCSRTNSGRYAKFRINSYGYDLQINYTTWQ